MSSSRIGGTLIPPGSHTSNQVGGKVYIPAARYPSKSGSGKTYTLCEVNDGSTSCDCMGWTRRNPPGGRTCKHTQDYETTLRADWQASAGGSPAPMPPVAVEPVVQAGVRERGGSLTDLLKKLEKEGVK